MRYTIPLALLVLACSEPANVHTSREACYMKAKAEFHIDAEQCADEACIDALAVELNEKKAACP